MPSVHANSSRARLVSRRCFLIPARGWRPPGLVPRAPLPLARRSAGCLRPRRQHRPEPTAPAKRLGAARNKIGAVRPRAGPRLHVRLPLEPRGVPLARPFDRPFASVPGLPFAPYALAFRGAPARGALPQSRAMCAGGPRPLAAAQSVTGQLASGRAHWPGRCGALGKVGVVWQSTAEAVLAYRAFVRWPAYRHAARAVLTRGGGAGTLAVYGTVRVIPALAVRWNGPCLAGGFNATLPGPCVNAVPTGKHIFHLET